MNRVEEFLAITAPPLMLVIGLGSGLDLISGGLISRFAPWFSLASPFILSAACVGQYAVCSRLMIGALARKKRQEALTWILLALPLAALLFVSCLVWDVQADYHLNYTEALAYLHMNQNTVSGTAIVMSVWVGFVGDRLRRVLKERRWVSREIAQ